MPVTKDQAEMLAALAAAARPHGAPRWDPPGIVAAIAKVKHLQLTDVMRALANAADDRDANTPAIITSLRSACWQDRPVRPAPPEVLAPDARCGICANSRQDCETRPRFGDDDHTFEPDFKTRRDGQTVRQIVTAIKAEVGTRTATTEEATDA